MGLLGSIFGNPNMTYRGTRTQRPVEECCTDGTLMPRWRGPEVMDDDSQAMGFVCHACGREFLPSQVRDRRLLRVPDAR